MSLYVFWLRKTPSIHHVRNWWGIERGRGHPKCVQLRVGTGGVTYDVYVRTYIVSCFICRNLMPIASANPESHDEHLTVST